MSEEALLFKHKGAYIVLNMTARLIERRAWEQLPGGLLKDFTDMVITDPFGNENREDSERWLNILEQAMLKDWNMYCLLMITRFAGTRLVDGGAYWKMEPIMHSENGYAWWTEKRWQEYRSDVLMPVADKMRDILLKNGR